MASLVKRGRQWWLDQYVGKGRRRIRRPLGAERTEAERIVAAVNDARNAASSALESADILSAVADEMRAHKPLSYLAADFLAAAEARVAPSTVSWYRTYLDRFVAAWQSRAWRSLTLGQLSRWLSSQVSQPSLVRTLRAFGRYCHREGLWPDNALTRLKALHPRRRSETLTSGEVARIEKVVAGTALEAPFLAGVYGGLRVSEICHARCELYDRKMRILTIGPWGTWTTKNRRVRRIPVHERLAKVIRDAAAGWLFVNASGGQWTRHYLYREMKATAGCGLHVLRHTFVSRLMAAGVGASVARDLAGHSSIAVTDGYAHTDLTALRAAVARL